MRSLNRQETEERLHAHGLDSPAGVGFAFLDPARNLFYDWHSHTYHQLAYAMKGPTRIESALGSHLLPAGRAAWIPAGTRHRTWVSDQQTASIFFSPEVVADRASRIRILVADPLMYAMILRATRWPRGASDHDPLAASFLHTLALLCGEWLEAELPLFLPGATHPSIVRAMDFAASDLASARQEDAAKAAAMSLRSFRRLFARETGMNWQAWLTQARIQKAMGMLIEGSRVTDTALEVGYSSLSAFALAFQKLAGETPLQFRQRQGRG